MSGDAEWPKVADAVIEAERPDGSQPAFAWGPVPRRGEPLSHLLPMGIRLLRPPLPAALSARLAARFPWREHDGLTKFRLRNRMG